MSKLVQLLAAFTFLMSSTAFAGVCEKDLMSARLAENVARLNALYPIPQYEKTVARYESATSRLSENKRVMWVDMIEESRVTEWVQRLIETRASGVTRRGYAYSVEGDTLTLLKDAHSFSVTVDADFGPGFKVKNKKTGGELQYSSQSLLDRARDPNPSQLDILLAKLRRFGFSYFDFTEVDAALDLSLSAQGIDPQLRGIRFDSLDDFSATLERYSLAGYYAALPLEQLPSKIARLSRKAANKDLIIGDHEYYVKTVTPKQLEKAGETGHWISISDEDRVYWVNNPARGEDMRILSFNTRGRSLKPLGSLVLSKGEVYPSADWIPENHRVVFALLIIFRDVGLE